MAAKQATANVARILETGSILGVLTLILAATGIMLSPTLLSAAGLYSTPRAANALYVTHLATAVLLVVFTAVHLWPLAYAFLKKAGATAVQRAGSYILLGLILVEILTGYELWSHNYVLIPKESNVGIHLVTTFILLVPLAIHSWRGMQVWRTRRQARADALSKATKAGAREKAVTQQRGLSRRLFLRLSVYGAAGIALAYSFGSAAKTQLGQWRLNSVGATPNLTKDSYTLRVSGLVQKPIQLSYAELIAMPAVTQRIVHHCVEGWTYEDDFTGVRLSDIIARAGGVTPNAQMVIFKSPEVSRQMFAYGLQYTSNFPVKAGVFENALVVYAAHGQDLPREHGFPVRLMTPKKWGYKACKWLTEIELSADPEYYGYWERAGYHNEGDYPGPIWA